MNCNYTFIKWAGRKCSDKFQGVRVGGAIFKTDCGHEAYGYELLNKPCIFCGKPVECSQKQQLKNELGIHC